MQQLSMWIREHRWQSVLTLLMAGFAFFLVRDQWVKAIASSHDAQCQSNLRQIGTALSMYVTDNDGKWPSVSLWNNQLGRSDLKGCPASGPLPTSGPLLPPSLQGYAYNYLIADKRDLPFPATTVSVCDASPGVYMTMSADPYHSYGFQPAAVEPGWERHSGAGNYLLCDGHVRRLAAKEVGDGGDDVEGNDGTHITFATHYGTRHTALQR